MCIANSKTRVSQLLKFSCLCLFFAIQSPDSNFEKEDLEILQTFLNFQNSVSMSQREWITQFIFKKRQDKIVIWELTNCGFQCNYPAASPACPLFHSFAMLTSWQSLQLKIMSSFILMSLKIMSLSSICHCFVKNQK